jgi:hypothetical protein
VLYSDGKLHQGWSDYSYNGKTNFKSTSNPDTVLKHTYSAYGNYTNWGALKLHTGGSIDVSAYDALSVAIHTSDVSGSQVQIALYGSTDPDHPFPALFISHYLDSRACILPDGWATATIPLVDLLPPAPSPAFGSSIAQVKVSDVEIKANYHTGIGSFWMDELKFVNTPLPPTPAPMPTPDPLPTPPAPAPTPGCADVAPAPGTYTCAQQKSWGKCDVQANPWMAGFCCKTCFHCQPGCGK